MISCGISCKKVSTSLMSDSIIRSRLERLLRTAMRLLFSIQSPGYQVAGFLIVVPGIGVGNCALVSMADRIWR